MDRRPDPTYSGRRVLFVIPWMVIGGAEKVSHDLVVGLRRRGYEPHIITTVPSSNPWHERFAAATPFITHLPTTLDTANHLRYITRYVRSAEIDSVVISNSSRGYQAAKPLKEQSPQIRIHDLLHGEHGGFPRISAAVDAYLDHHIVVSSSLKHNLIHRHGLPPQRIKVIHNGIDAGQLRQHGTATARYRRELNILPDTFVVAYVGRFSPEKRPDRVIESFAGLRSQLPSAPVKLIMAGDGELRDALVARVGTLNLDRDVHFVGFIDDVPGLLADTDVLVLTSQTEGMPIVVLEAMALEKPVVATAVGGVPEIIEEGRSGLLVQDDRRAVVAVQDHLRVLLQDRTLRSDIGREAANRVQMEFSLESMVRRYAALL